MSGSALGSTYQAANGRSARGESMRRQRGIVPQSPKIVRVTRRRQRGMIGADVGWVRVVGGNLCGVVVAAAVVGAVAVAAGIVVAGVGVAGVDVDVAAAAAAAFVHLLDRL